MKKNNFVIYLTALLLIIYSLLIEPFILDNFLQYIDVINISVLILLCLFAYFCFGINRKRSMINYSLVQNIVICFIVYYVLTYLFGLFFGFLSNSYSLKFLNITKNISIALVIYIGKELYRYMIAKKIHRDNYWPYVFVTIALTLFDIAVNVGSYDFSNASVIFEFIEVDLVPTLALNAMLSYFAYKSNYKLSILFLILFDMTKYFLPFFPDMGNYIGSMVKLIFIFVCYYNVSLIMERYDRKINRTKKESKGYLIFLVIIPLFILIGLTSGLFKYHLFAIGSNSMLPVFARGDATLIEKLDKEEYDKIEVDDILAFYYNNQIIVHRVVGISKNKDQYIIQTKGDNNDSKDAWLIKNDNIYGKVKFIVKYVGLPSVELSELINEKW